MLEGMVTTDTELEGTKDIIIIWIFIIGFFILITILKYIFITFISNDTR